MAERRGTDSSVRGAYVFATPLLVGIAFAMVDLPDISIPAMLVTGIALHLERKRARARANATLRTQGGKLSVSGLEPAARLETPLVDLLDVRLDTKTIQRVQENPGVAALRFIHATVGPPLDVARIELVTRDRSVFLTEEYFSHSDSLEWKGKIRQFLRKSGWVPDSERVEDEPSDAAKEPARRPRPIARPAVEPAPSKPVKAPLRGWLLLWAVALVAYPLLTLRDAPAVFDLFTPYLDGSPWWTMLHLTAEGPWDLAIFVVFASARVAVWLLTCEATHRRLAQARSLALILGGLTAVEAALRVVLRPHDPAQLRLLAGYLAWSLPCLLYFFRGRRPAVTFTQLGRLDLRYQAIALGAFAWVSFAIHVARAPEPAAVYAAQTTTPTEMIGRRILLEPAFQRLARKYTARYGAPLKVEARQKLDEEYADTMMRGFRRLDESRLLALAQMRHRLLRELDVVDCAETWRKDGLSARSLNEGIRPEDIEPWAEVEAAAFAAGEDPATPELIAPAVATEAILLALPEPSRSRLRNGWSDPGSLSDEDACWSVRALAEAIQSVRPEERLATLRWMFGR